MLVKEKSDEGGKIAEFDSGRLNEILTLHLLMERDKELRSRGQRREQEIEIFQNKVGKSLELKTLLRTLKRQGGGNDVTLPRTVVDQLRHGTRGLGL